MSIFKKPEPSAPSAAAEPSTLESLQAAIAGGQAAEAAVAAAAAGNPETIAKLDLAVSKDRIAALHEKLAAEAHAKRDAALRPHVEVLRQRGEALLNEKDNAIRRLAAGAREYRAVYAEILSLTEFGGQAACANLFDVSRRLDNGRANDASQVRL